MKLSIEMIDGKIRNYQSKLIRLSYGVFGDKRKSEQYINIDLGLTEHILKLKEIKFMKVEE